MRLDFELFDVIDQTADALCSAGDHLEISVSKVHSVKLAGTSVVSQMFLNGSEMSKCLQFCMFIIILSRDKNSHEKWQLSYCLSLFLFLYKIQTDLKELTSENDFCSRQLIVKNSKKDSKNGAS